MKHLSYRIVDVSSVKVSTGCVLLSYALGRWKLTMHRKSRGDGTRSSSSGRRSRDRRRARIGELKSRNKQLTAARWTTFRLASTSSSSTASTSSSLSSLSRSRLLPTPLLTSPLSRARLLSEHPHRLPPSAHPQACHHRTLTGTLRASQIYIISYHIRTNAIRPKTCR